MNHHTGGTWFIPGPQRHKENKMLRTLLSIILSVVCESDIKEVNGKVSNPLFKKNVRDQNGMGCSDHK